MEERDLGMLQRPSGSTKEEPMRFLLLPASLLIPEPGGVKGKRPWWQWLMLPAGVPRKHSLMEGWYPGGGEKKQQEDCMVKGARRRQGAEQMGGRDKMNNRRRQQDQCNSKSTNSFCYMQNKWVFSWHSLHPTHIVGYAGWCTVKVGRSWHTGEGQGKSCSPALKLWLIVIKPGCGKINGLCQRNSNG